MQITLLRHAQPMWTGTNGRGVTDPPLTRLGLSKASELRESLGQEPFDTISVSPYRRCRETADAVFPDRHKITRDWLREITLPDFSLTPAEQVHRYFRESKRRPLADWWDGVQGGESFRDFHQRIADGLDGYLADLGIRRMRPTCRHDRFLFEVPEEQIGKRHLIVSHLGTSGLIMSHLLHLELVPWVWESFCLDWNGVVRLETNQVADGYIFSLRKFNEYGHLDPGLDEPIVELEQSGQHC